VPLEVARQAVIAADPRHGPLHDPAVGQDGEFVQLIALDDLDDPAARGGGRICDASP